MCQILCDDCVNGNSDSDEEEDEDDDTY